MRRAQRVRLSLPFRGLCTDCAVLWPCSYGCLTFLHTDSTKGALQVLKRKTHEEGGTDATADEGEWITADPSVSLLLLLCPRCALMSCSFSHRLPGCFVVNVGQSCATT